MDQRIHTHVYDNQGRQICCTQEEKINREAHLKNRVSDEDHDGHDHSSGDAHGESESGILKYLNVYVSTILFVVGLVLDQLSIDFMGKYQREIVYGTSYFAVAYPVFKEAIKAFSEKVFFSEFTLMGLATLGAMAIGEYPEGVAVMLFYSVGEIFQTAAVSRAKASIKALLDLRSNSTSVLRNGVFEEVDPKTVQLGETTQVRSGESVALDGVLLSPIAQMNTAALTGESAPREFQKGEKILAGMINQGALIQMNVEKIELPTVFFPNSCNITGKRY
ncbi:heavy metal translocating P-type ATPase, partial [bacterium]|nr:heavy metal translocating P-type ATPase [bacterium]